MLELLKRRKTLWLLFVAILALTVVFQLISQHWGMTFLDALSSPEAAKAHVAALSAEQIRVHIWTTAVVDVLYPLVYGPFFAGVALACFPRFGLMLAAPSFLVIGVDITEGVVQIAGLLGEPQWLDWKAVLTPAKFGLFFIGLGIAVVGWLKWGWEKVRAS